MTLPDFTATLKAAADGIMRLSDPDGLYSPGTTINPVENLRVTYNSTDAQTVSWSYPYDNHDAFEHQYRDSAIDTAWRPATTLDATARSVSVSGLTDNTSIGHRVRALEGAEAGAWVEVWHTTEDQIENPYPPDTSAHVYQKLGTLNDADVSNAMYCENWSWGHWWGYGDRPMAFCEDVLNNKFYWAQEPPSRQGMITGRPAKNRKRCDLRVNASNLPKTGPLYITIRFKDQIPGGTAAYQIRSGGNVLAQIGGAFDKRWKTTQFIVESSQLLWEGGTFQLTFGEEYDDRGAGELVIDRLKVGVTNNTNEFPPDEAGLWPLPAVPNRHANIKNDHQWERGETPKFRYGVYFLSVQIVGADAGPTTASIEANDQFQMCEDANMNCIVHHMWSNTGFMGSKWLSGDPGNLPTGTQRIEMGNVEMAFHAEAHGMQAIFNPLTDSQAYFIDPNGDGGRVFENSPAVLEYWGTHLPTLLASDGCIGYNPSDESDHDATNYKMPLTMQQQAYVLSKDIDPDKPVYNSLMGYHGPATWLLYQESADILGNDRYFWDNGNGSWESLEEGLLDMCRYLDDAAATTDNSTLAGSITGCATPSENVGTFPPGIKRQGNSEEMVIQHYLALCHLARFNIGFEFQHPLVATDTADLWTGMQQIGDELFGASGIGDWLIFPALDLDVMGRNGLAVVDNEAIHSTLKEYNGDKLLITANVRHAGRQGTFTLSGIADGTYPVRFEGRNITVSGGQFTDDWPQWGRHVYDFTGA